MMMAAGGEEEEMMAAGGEEEESRLAARLASGVFAPGVGREGLRLRGSVRVAR